MKNQLIVASLFGITLSLAACGSEEAGCINDPESVSAEQRDNEASQDEEEQQGEDVCTADTWANYGQAFIADNCVQCHRNFTKFATVQARASRMADMVESGRMPKTGPLPADEQARLVKYLRCGAPE